MRAKAAASDNIDLADGESLENRENAFDANQIKIGDLTLTNCNEFLDAVTDTMTIQVTPTMLLLALPNTISKGRDGKPNSAIQANIFDVNHNDPNSGKGYEIMNNMMGDIFQTDFNTFKKT